MIKYSHRGLVVNGKLPFLFYQQYLLISFVFYCQWFFLLVYFAFFSSDSLDENILETFRGGGKQLVAPVRYFAMLICIFLVLFLFMSLGIFYSKRKSKKHYRQNVNTFNLTLFWGLLHCLLFISLFVTKSMEEIHAFSVIRFLSIFTHFIKSIATIFENQKNFPELFSDIETKNQPFYFNQTNLYPRQETFMPFIPFRQNAR